MQLQTSQMLNAFSSSITSQHTNKPIKPYKTSTHLYATNNQTTIKIDRQAVIGSIDDAQFLSTGEPSNRVYAFIDLPLDNHITIGSKIMLDMLFENISSSLLDIPEPITQIVLDNSLGEVKFETATNRHSYYAGEDDKPSYVNLSKSNNDCHLAATDSNISTHVYIQTSELYKILSLFINSPYLTISFTDSNSRIKFHNDTIQAITMPYKQL